MSQSQGNLNNQSEPCLTARQIFDQLIAGKAVRIPPDETLANQLKNHLNVLKSRHRKLFSSLGLDSISSVISVQFVDAIRIPPDEGSPDYEPNKILGIPAYYEIKLVAPKKRRHYPAFVIQEENNNNEQSNTI